LRRPQLINQITSACCACRGPSWMMQPGVRSDMKPAPGTSVGPFNQ
jgi:hypothetical protein